MVGTDRARVLVWPRPMCPPPLASEDGKWVRHQTMLPQQMKDFFVSRRDLKKRQTLLIFHLLTYTRVFILHAVSWRKSFMHMNMTVPLDWVGQATRSRWLKTTSSPFFFPAQLFFKIVFQTLWGFVPQFFTYFRFFYLSTKEKWKKVRGEMKSISCPH